jgi:hypothetical protein
MTKEELAAMLDGRKIGHEISKEENLLAEENGLVVVFGYSDDCVEFRGAILDEGGVYDGGIVYLDQSGLWESECEENECPYAKKEQSKCKTIRAVWHDEGNPCWTYETEIPHAKFNIYEDEELFCVGIVFEMAALKGER